MNPVPAGSFPAIPLLGGGSSCCGCDFTEPNMAVKSPTFFFGGSWGRGGEEDKAGTSDGRSPRNGPWKKLVNSPGLGPADEGAGSGVKFLADKSGRKGPDGRLISGVGLGGTENCGGSGSFSGLHRGAARRGSGAGVRFGGGGSAGFEATPGTADRDCDSKVRSNCVTGPGTCGGSVGARSAGGGGVGGAGVGGAGTVTGAGVSRVSRG